METNHLAQILQELESLQQAGAEQLIVHFSGNGDSGEIGSTSVLPETIQLPENSLIENHFEELLEKWLNDEHGGWEIDDGSSGSLTYNFSDKTVSFVIEEYFLSSETTETKMDYNIVVQSYAGTVN